MKNKLIIILSIIVFLIFFAFIIKNVGNNSKSKYTDLEIKKLISKGFENFNNMYFESYDFETSEISEKVYYYKDKYKMTRDVNGYPCEFIRYDKEKKSYNVDRQKNIIYDNTSSEHDWSVVSCLELKKGELEDPCTKFEYIKDEKYDDKNCIVIRKYKTYDRDDSSEWDDFAAYWIDKETGFVVCRGDCKMDTKETKKYDYIKNIKIGDLKDSDFELPKGYKTIKTK